jgi:hypothetical protein
VGLFTRDPAGRYAVTGLGEQLREDHPGRRRRWLDLAGAVGKGDLAFVELAHTVRTGRPAYPVRYGIGFWDDLAADPELSASFDALMEHHVARDAAEATSAYDWAALGHVVDVGGGRGALLASLLAGHPGLRGTLVDLAGPAAAARTALRRQGLADRVEVVVGSFFDPLPAGAGGYVLSAILHDWDDAAATRILRRCAEAAGVRGVVLVIEAVGVDGESPDTSMDLRMLVYYGGQERGVTDLSALAAAAGLVRRGVHPLHPGSFISIVEFGPA